MRFVCFSRHGPHSLVRPGTPEQRQLGIDRDILRGTDCVARCVAWDGTRVFNRITLLWHPPQERLVIATMWSSSRSSRQRGHQARVVREAEHKACSIDVLPAHALFEERLDESPVPGHEIKG